MCFPKPENLGYLDIFSPKNPGLRGFIIIIIIIIDAFMTHASSVMILNQRRWQSLGRWAAW